MGEEKEREGERQIEEKGVREYTLYQIGQKERGGVSY
jgi:hypothetical protein